MAPAAIDPGHFGFLELGALVAFDFFLAQIGAQDTVTVTVWNRSGAAVDLNPGTVRVRVVKA